MQLVRSDGSEEPSARRAALTNFHAHACAPVTGCAKGLMEKVNMEPKDFAYVVFHQPNGKFPQRVGKMLGFTKEQIEPGWLSPTLGNTYSGSSPMGLTATLDVAKPGDMILMVSYGSGAGSDGFVFEVTDRIDEVRKIAPGTREMLDKKKKIEKQAHEQMPEPIDVEGIPAKLRGMFEHSIWEEIAERCLGCGVCTYLCPTCHCFDIQDETIGNKGRRIKNWDSCMFPIFTLHGSGHQPRELRFQRMRQRIMHKFNYYEENFGVIACSGCGR